MNESYEEWLEMVREEDARNRQAFTGERPLTVTEFIHRKDEHDRAERERAFTKMVELVASPEPVTWGVIYLTQSELDGVDYRALADMPDAGEQWREIDDSSNEHSGHYGQGSAGPLWQRQQCNCWVVGLGPC